MGLAMPEAEPRTRVSGHGAMLVYEYLTCH